MTVLNDFKSYSRIDQNYILESLYEYAKNKDSQSQKDLQGMINHYTYYTQFESRRLRYEKLTYNRSKALQDIVRILANNITNNGIGEIKDKEYIKDAFNNGLVISDNEVIELVIHQAINYLDIDRTYYEEKELSHWEFTDYIIDLDEFELIYKKISEFVDEMKEYVETAPYVEKVMNIISNIDNYIRTVSDNETLKVYNKLNTVELMYLYAMVLQYSDNELDIHFEKYLKSKDKDISSTPCKPKLANHHLKKRYPRIRERKKVNNFRR